MTTKPHLTSLGLWIISAGIANGVPYAMMAVAFGVKKDQVKSAADRYILGRVDKRTNATRRANVRPGRTWESALTEPWHVFHARKVAERRAAKEQQHG